MPAHGSHHPELQQSRVLPVKWRKRTITKEKRKHLGKEIYFIEKKKITFHLYTMKIFSYFQKKRLRLPQENHILYYSITLRDEALVVSALGIFH